MLDPARLPPASAAPAPPDPAVSAARAPALSNPPRVRPRLSSRSLIYAVASFADQPTWRRRPEPFVIPTAIVSPEATATVWTLSRHEAEPAPTVHVTAVALPFT